MNYIDFTIAVSVFLLFFVLVIYFTSSYFSNYSAISKVSELKLVSENFLNTIFSDEGIPSNWHENSSTLPVKIGLVDEVFVIPVIVEEDGNYDRNNEPITTHIIFDESCELRARNSAIRVFDENLKDLNFELTNKTFCSGEFLKESDVSWQVNISSNQKKKFFIYFSSNKGIEEPPTSHLVYDTDSWFPSDGDSWTETTQNWKRYGGASGVVALDSYDKIKGNYSVTINGTFNSTTLGLELSIYSFRRKITIQEESGKNLTYYQVKLNISYDPDMQNDFDDLRFTYYNSTSKEEVEIPYWIEKKVDSSWALVWVKVPFIPANENATIFMYYGNPVTGSEASGEEVFEFFDDFNDLNTTIWTEPLENNYRGYTIENGKLVLYVGTRGKSTVWNAGSRTTTKNKYVIQDRVIEIRTNMTMGGTIYDATNYRTNQSIIGFYYTDLNGNKRGYGRHQGQNYWLKYNKINGTDSYVLWHSGTWDGSSTGFHVLSMAIKGSSVKLFEDGELKTTYSDSFQPDISNISLVTHVAYYLNDGWGEQQIDWIRIRKFTDPEPSYTIGDEEKIAPTLYNDWYLDFFISIDNTTSLSSVSVSVTDVLNNSITQNILNNLDDNQWYHFLDVLNSTNWSKSGAFNASNGVTKIIFWMENSSPNLTRTIKIDRLFFRKKPLVVHNFPQEKRKVISMIKFNSLKNISYDIIRKTIGENYKFSIFLDDKRYGGEPGNSDVVCSETPRLTQFENGSIKLITVKTCVWK